MALEIISYINLDMKAPNAAKVYGEQYDNAGYVHAQLLNDGTKWAVPAGAIGVVSYIKSDRVGGYYDTTERGETAVAIGTDRSTIMIALDQQTLSSRGRVDVNVSFYLSNQRLSTFSFLLQVNASTIVASNIDSKWFGRLLLTAGEFITDDTLSILGAAADAKATGTRITNLTNSTTTSINALSADILETYNNLNADIQSVNRNAAQLVSNETSRATNEENKKVNKPIVSPNGIAGQLLRTNGDGTTEWVSQGQPTDQQTEDAIFTWLNNHPEATTTVEDGSLTEEKFTQDVLNKLNITGSSHAVVTRTWNHITTQEEFENYLQKFYDGGETIWNCYLDAPGVYKIRFPNMNDATQRIVFSCMEAHIYATVENVTLDFNGAIFYTSHISIAGIEDDTLGADYTYRLINSREDISLYFEGGTTLINWAHIDCTIKTWTGFTTIGHCYFSNGQGHTGANIESIGGEIVLNACTFNNVREAGDTQVRALFGLGNGAEIYFASRTIIYNVSPDNINNTKDLIFLARQTGNNNRVYASGSFYNPARPGGYSPQFRGNFGVANTTNVFIEIIFPNDTSRSQFENLYFDGADDSMVYERYASGLVPTENFTDEVTYSDPDHLDEKVFLRNGKTVSIHLMSKNETFASGTHLFTLPAGYFNPGMVTRIPFVTNNGGFGHLMINTQGRCVVNYIAYNDGVAKSGRISTSTCYVLL